MVCGVACSDPSTRAGQDERVSLIRDLTDDEARAALPLKWGAASADVLPAWVAEMDYAPAEPLTEALHGAVREGASAIRGSVRAGSWARPTPGSPERHFGWPVDPDHVLPVVDVTAGLRLALDVLPSPVRWCSPSPPTRPHHDIGGSPDGNGSTWCSIRTRHGRRSTWTGSTGSS